MFTCCISWGAGMEKLTQVAFKRNGRRQHGCVQDSHGSVLHIWIQQRKQQRVKIVYITWTKLVAEQDQLPYGSAGTSSGSCQEMETCMVRGKSHAMTASIKPPFRYCGGWAMPWSVEEMLDGPHEVWTCQNCSQWPPAGKTGIFAELSCMSPWQPDQSRDWTELILHNASAEKLWRFVWPFSCFCFFVLFHLSVFELSLVWSPVLVLPWRVGSLVMPVLHRNKEGSHKNRAYFSPL